MTDVTFKPDEWKMLFCVQSRFVEKHLFRNFPPTITPKWISPTNLDPIKNQLKENRNTQNLTLFKETANYALKSYRFQFNQIFLKNCIAFSLTVIQKDLIFHQFIFLDVLYIIYPKKGQKSSLSLSFIFTVFFWSSNSWDRRKCNGDFSSVDLGTSM